MKPFLMNMVIIEYVRKFHGWANHVTKAYKRFKRNTLQEDDIVMAILTEVIRDYDTEIRILEIGDDLKPTQRENVYGASPDDGADKG